MDGFDFQTVAHVRLGPGVVRTLPQRLSESGVPVGATVLLVTDGFLAGTSGFRELIQGLEAQGHPTAVFDQVQADPTDTLALEAAELARTCAAGAIVGFGGGSSMDVAKVVSCLAHPGQSVTLAGLYGVNTCVLKRLPLMLVPTTAGTGSEATSIAILTVGAEQKSGIVNRALLADQVFLDAELTIGLPPAVTAATGVDAMVHALEAYTSAIKKNPISDQLAKSALLALSQHLLRVFRQGDDLRAREQMLLGAFWAGQAFENAPCAAVHALAYPLGGIFHVSHGVSNALVLPHVMRFNLSAARTQYAELARTLMPVAGANPQGGGAVLAVGEPANDQACGEALIDYFEQFIRLTGIPSRLRDYGVSSGDLPRLAASAMSQQRLLKNNPRPVTEADALAIYLSAF